MAHVITLVRVLLTLPLILALRGALPSWLSPFLFAAIAASDIVDGRVARAARTDSDWGRAFDHGADIVFILTTLFVYAQARVVPWWVPTSIVFAFTLYVVDVRTGLPATPARRLAARIGHWGGVCNYVLIGVLIGNETLGLHVLPAPLIALLFAVVPMYSVIPVAIRWWPASTKPRSILTIR